MAGDYNYEYRQLPSISKDMEMAHGRYYYSSKDDEVRREKQRTLIATAAAAVVALAILGCTAMIMVVRVTDDTTTSGGEEFKTPRKRMLSSDPYISSSPHLRQSTESLDFLVLGDWGRRGLYNQSQVATQMGRIGEERSIKFVVSVGDNFYDTGLKGQDDPAFTASFTDVYTSPSLQTTWYSVLGNHDYMGDALSQLSDELARRDSRWFCRKEFELHRSLCFDADDASCDASLGMFFIDTTPFIDDYWKSNGSRRFDWRGLAPRPQQLHSQLQRLEESLRASNATWKIVFGHHTIRSVGRHGDMPELVQQLLPILEKYGVHAYINGHDHNLQHIKRADSAVHLFTSGAGSKAYSGLRPYTEEDGVKFAYDGQGFLAMSVQPSSASFTFYDVFGQDIYSYALPLPTSLSVL